MMKLLTATVLSLSLLASAWAQANPAGAAEGSGAPQTAPMQDSQTINITRSGSVPSGKGPAENFTGSVRVDPLFQAKDPARTSGANVPKLVELTDNLLFGDVWELPQLSKPDRSLVTVAALIATNRPDQLGSHLARARENGATQEESIETTTHLGFYAGWPDAVTAIAAAGEVFEKK